MAITKRTRFEVLRRDNHTCRYCRATDAPLTIDHVTPKALGGTDDPGNLVTACRDCNAGKSSSAPDATLVADVSADALRWISARKEAAAAFNGERGGWAQRAAPFRDAWAEWDADLTFLPIDWDHKVNSWLDDGLTMGRMLDAYRIALSRPSVRADGMFAYMCGIVRNWIADIEARAKLLIDGEEVALPTADDILVDFIDRYGRCLVDFMGEVA